MNVALFHFALLVLQYNIKVTRSIDYYFQLRKWLVFVFLVLHYCINLKFHYLLIVLSVEYVHAIFLLSNYVILNVEILK